MTYAYSASSVGLMILHLCFDFLKCGSGKRKNIFVSCNKNETFLKRTVKEQLSISCQRGHNFSTYFHITEITSIQVTIACIIYGNQVLSYSAGKNTHFLSEKRFLKTIISSHLGIRSTVNAFSTMMLSH